MSCSLLSILIILLAGCAAAPMPLPPDHPASLRVRESAPPSTRLGLDDNTRRTREQLTHHEER